MISRHKTTIIDELRGALAAATESGKTQVEIAKSTKVRQEHLSRFLSGDRGLSLERAAKLCSYLKLHLVRQRQR